MALNVNNEKGEKTTMEAYKCDICGKYCNTTYNLKNDLFDLHPYDFIKRGYRKYRMVLINDLCPECFKNIKEYVHDMYFKNLQQSIENNKMRGHEILEK